MQLECSSYGFSLFFAGEQPRKAVFEQKCGLDYYPFGMQMPGRTFVADTTNNYRYSMNGQEKDDEIYGTGNSYTAEYWQYDSRLGRRWNVDPVVKSYESPYATFANNQVWFTVPFGNDTTAYIFSSVNTENGE